jgi:hypothetical protein
LSAAIGELARGAERALEPGGDSPRLKRNEHGYLEIAEAGSLLKPAMVKEAEEDELVQGSSIPGDDGQGDAAPGWR